MATTADGRTPAHLWIIGLLALLWNCFGCYDYTMTRLRNTDYIASAMPGVDPSAALAWVDAMPFYAQIGWGLGVWMGLLGALFLLLRSRFAVWALALSFIGALLSLGYQIALAPPLDGATSPMMRILPYIIILITGFLAWYSRAMEKRGVLR